MPSKPVKSQAKTKRAPSKKGQASEEKPKRKRGRPKGSGTGSKKEKLVLEKESLPKGLTKGDALTVKEQETEARIAQIDKAIRSIGWTPALCICLLYTSDAADE